MIDKEKNDVLSERDYGNILRLIRTIDPNHQVFITSIQVISEMFSFDVDKEKGN